MSVSGAGSNSSLMSWLITHNNQLNDSLDEAMNKGDVSVAAQKEAKDLLTEMKNADGLSYQKVVDEIKSFIASHVKDPDCKQLIEVLGPMVSSYENARTLANKNNDPAGAAKAVEGLPDKLQNELDAMKKLDETGMMRINDLSSQKNQAFQLASNMMAGSNQVLSGIINNLKG